MMKTRYYWLKIKNIFNKYTKKSYFLTKYRISAQNRMRPRAMIGNTPTSVIMIKMQRRVGFES